MSAVQSTRHLEIGLWALACLLALLLVLVALTRVAGATPAQPPEPLANYIVSPYSGTFVAGEKRGEEPCVTVGSKLKPGTVVGNVEVWGKLRPVESMVRGTVIEVLVVDEGMVMTGQLLFTVQVEVEPRPA